jgi:peptide/nickel transport system permease protein
VGSPHGRIALRHIKPNVLQPLIIQATLSIASAVIAEASLSFLGLGQQPPQPRCGSILKLPKTTWTTPSLMAVWPGASIFLLVLSFNLVGMACAMRWTPDKNE